MEYRIVVEKIENVLSRDVEAAAGKLDQQVNALLSSGWDVQGGVAIGSAGTAPYLFQALVKR